MIKRWICSSCHCRRDIEWTPDMKYPEGSIPASCPECQSKSYNVKYITREDFNLTSQFCNIDGMMKENERYSVALGVLDEQLAEARRLSPQTEWKKFGNSWRPRIRNRAEKLRIMKQNKMEETF